MANIFLISQERSSQKMKSQNYFLKMKNKGKNVEIKSKHLQ